MSLFDPAAILQKLITGLGVSPELLQGAYALVVQELQAMRHIASMNSRKSRRSRRRLCKRTAAATNPAFTQSGSTYSGVSAINASFET